MSSKTLLWLIASLLTIPIVLAGLSRGIPEWELTLVSCGAFLLVGLPVVVANDYRMLRQPRPVDRGALVNRLAAFRAIEPDLTRLGFVPIDTFRILTLTDLVYRVFRLGETATYLLAFDAPATPLPDSSRAVRVELRSELDDGSTLTSSTKESVGTPLRRAEDYLQLLPGAGLNELLLAHVEGLQFLASRGLRPSLDLHDGRSWRAHFAEYVRDELDVAHQGWSWPLRELGRAIRRAHRKYLGSVEDQVADGRTAVSVRKGGPRWRSPGETEIAVLPPARRVRPPRRPAKRALHSRGRTRSQGTLASYRLKAYVLAGFALVVASRQLWPKPGANAWTRLGPSWRSIHAIATAPGGRLAIATDRVKHGDVYESRDAGATWTPWGLDGQEAWAVAFVDGGHRVCAGLEDGLECRTGADIERASLRHSVYWLGEHPVGLLSVGYPSVDLAPGGDLSRTRELFRSSKAIHGATVLDDGTILAVGTGLFVSEDHGATFATRWTAPDGTYLQAIAARGPRVYVTGGLRQGGFFRSDDGGRSFVQLGAPQWNPDRMLIPTSDPDVLLLAAAGIWRPGDVYLSRDGGHTWKALGCPGVSPETLATDGEALYCGSNGALLGDGLWRRPLADALAP